MRAVTRPVRLTLVFLLSLYSCGSDSGDRRPLPPTMPAGEGSSTKEAPAEKPPARTEEKATPAAEQKEPQLTEAEKKLAALLSAVQQEKRSVRNFAARAEFYSYLPAWEEETTSTGTIKYKTARGHARVTFADNKGVKIVLIEDGPFLWRHYPDKKQVEKYFQGSDGSMRTVMEILASPVEKLKKEFNIKLSEGAAGGQSLLSLSYLNPDRHTRKWRIDVTFDANHHPVVFSITKGNGDVSRWTMQEVRINDPELEAEDLAFHPGAIKGLSINDLVKDTVDAGPLAEAVLSLVRDNGSWSHGWKGTFLMKPDKGELVSGRFVTSMSGAFNICTWNPAQESDRVWYVFDGNSFTTCDEKKKEARLAAGDRATDSLPGDIRLVLLAVRGELAAKEYAFEASKPGEAQKREQEDPSYYPTRFVLTGTPDGMSGFKGLEMSIDKGSFHVTGLSFADARRGAVSVRISQEPLPEPASGKEFSFTVPDGVKVIKPEDAAK